MLQGKLRTGYTGGKKQVGLGTREIIYGALDGVDHVIRTQKEWDTKIHTHTHTHSNRFQNQSNEQWTPRKKRQRQVGVWEAGKLQPIGRESWANSTLRHLSLEIGIQGPKVFRETNGNFSPKFFKSLKFFSLKV